MDRISLAKYCINCMYSVWCNDRLLCIKHGVTTENDDYCHDLDERPIVVIQEVHTYDKENKGED